MAPGHGTSLDQLMSSIPGIFINPTGQLIQGINYVSHFIDHASRLTYIHFHNNMGTDDTLQGKIAYERYFLTFSNHVRCFRTDLASAHTSYTFRSYANAQAQNITYTGTNTHFQNGIAKRDIRNVV